MSLASVYASSSPDSVSMPDDALTLPTFTVSFVAEEAVEAVIAVSAWAIIDMVMAPDAANAITSGLIWSIIRMG